MQPRLLEASVLGTKTKSIGSDLRTLDYTRQARLESNLRYLAAGAASLRPQGRYNLDLTVPRQSCKINIPSILI